MFEVVLIASIADVFELLIKLVVPHPYDQSPGGHIWIWLVYIPSESVSYLLNHLTEVCVLFVIPCLDNCLSLSLQQVSIRATSIRRYDIAH